MAKMTKADIQAAFDEVETSIGGGFEDLPFVEYSEIGNSFELYTTSEEAVKSMPRVKFEYCAKGKTYSAKVKTLQQGWPVELSKIDRRPPSAKEMARFQAVYDRYTSKKEVLDKMMREIDKDEAALIKMLDTFGLALKPGSRDRRLMAGDTLVHSQESIRTDIDEEQVVKAAKKHPSLSGVYSTVTIQRIDRTALHNALEHLPGAIAAKIFTSRPVMSFNERRITRPDCQYCGKSIKEGSKVCQECGIDKA